MSYSDAWTLADAFSLEQAAYLWCEKEPVPMSGVPGFGPAVDPDVAAIFGVLQNSAFAGTLTVIPVGGLHIIGDHSKSIVSRDNLIEFAKAKSQTPKFLFDTLISDQDPQTSGEDRPKAGRPAKHDWDACIGEVVRIANLPDGLPDKKAVVDHLKEWFSLRPNGEPAQSDIYKKIKPVFDYLENYPKK